MISFGSVFSLFVAQRRQAVGIFALIIVERWRGFSGCQPVALPKIVVAISAWRSGLMVLLRALFAGLGRTT
ncbi:hypothetical protein ACNKHK_24885 [Shigella flexneri]